MQCENRYARYLPYVNKCNPRYEIPEQHLTMKYPKVNLKLKADILYFPPLFNIVLFKVGNDVRRKFSSIILIQMLS